MKGHRLLLCTDLDRTLLPNGAQPESPQARQRFSALAACPEVRLVFVTGRDRERVERVIGSYQLPQPDFVIGDVGTSIYDLRQGSWDPLPQWAQEIAPDWNGRSQRQLSELLGDFSELRLQERSRQNTFKLSYYAPLYIDQQQTDRKLRERLERHGIDASLVWSVDEPNGIGLLDVLPRNATKRHALEFLQTLLGIPLEDTLFAGDSGNDLPVLASPIPSVLVANAMPSVAAEALAAAEALGTASSLYLAHGGFMGMNGNYSAGILEGLAHFHPQMVALFDGSGADRHQASD